MNSLKKCSKCKKLKPATTEHFHSHSQTRDGLQSWCRQCNSRLCRKTRLQRLAKNPSPQRETKGKPESKPAETRLEREIEAFLAARKNLAPGTLKNYARNLLHFAEAYPEFPPTPQDVTDYLANGGYNENTKQSTFTQIRTFVNWLRKTKRVEGDPLEAIVRPRKVDLLPRGPKERDVKRVLDYLEGRVEQALQLDPIQSYRIVRDLATFSLMLDTGLRIGEVFNLDLSDIDFDEMSAFISEAKNRKQRYVMFGKRVKGNLSLWLKVRAELGIPDKVTALFVTEWAGWGRCTPSSLAHSLTRYCQAVAAKRFSPHQLRHFHAGQAINNGQNIEALRQQLGHSDIKMTARYFMLPSEGRLKGHLRTSPLDNLGGAV